MSTPANPNVVTNPGAELGTTGWLGQSDGITQPLLFTTTYFGWIEYGAYALGMQLQNTDGTIPLNGTFETDVSGWAAGGGGSIARSTTQKHAGAASCAFTLNPAGGAYAIVSPAPALTPGKTYQLSGWMYVPSGQTNVPLNCAAIAIADYDGAVWDQANGPFPTAYDTWQYVTVTKTIRATATYTQAEFAQGANATGLIYYDDVQLIEIPAVVKSSVVYNSPPVPVVPGQVWYLRVYGSYIGQLDVYLGVHDSTGRFRDKTNVPAEFRDINSGSSFNHAMMGQNLETYWTVPEGITGASIGVRSYIPAGQSIGIGGDTWTMVLAQDAPVQVSIPAVGSFAQAVYDQLSPLQYAEEQLDYPLLRYVGALAEMFQPLDYLSGNSWNVLLDINRIPDEGLPWFGQFVGVNVDTSLSTDNQRQQIRDHIGWSRGTVGAITNAVRNAIGFNAPISLRERKPDAYSFEIVIYADPTTSQYEGIYETQPTYDYLVNNWVDYETIWTASGGVAAVTAAAMTQKPAGLVLSLRASAGQDYWDLYNRYATYLDIYNGFPTYLEVYNTIPTIDPIVVNHVVDLNTYLELWNVEENYGTVYSNYLAY